MCDGLGSTLAALFGVLPNTSFSQNVGLVSMTKVVNRFALATGASIPDSVRTDSEAWLQSMSIMPQSCTWRRSSYDVLIYCHQWYSADHKRKDDDEKILQSYP